MGCTESKYIQENGTIEDFNMIEKSVAKTDHLGYEAELELPSFEEDKVVGECAIPRSRVIKKPEPVKGNELYCDPDFPANDQSLCGGIKKPKDWEGVVWLRVNEIFSDMSKVKVFDQIEPGDIKQGCLGDCYFLAALSCMASNPNLIKSFFETQEVSTKGIYSIRMYINGELKSVNVDDRIPCYKFNKKPAFTGSNGSELWVILLEKAYAKVHGSYAAIISGNPSEPMRMLTGAPSETINHKESKNLIEIMKKALQGNQILCGGVDNAPNTTGLVSNHFYSILDVVEAEGQTLVKVRNPWGAGEWKGKWSDGDKVNWTSKLKAAFNFTSQDDGTFYMSPEDYLAYFNATSFSRYNENMSLSSQAFFHKKGDFSTIKVTIENDIQGYMFSNLVRSGINGTPVYKNYPVRIGLWRKEDSGSFTYISGNNFIGDTLYLINNGELVRGEYYILFECMFQIPDTNVLVISAYATEKVTYEQLKPDYAIIREMMKAVCLSGKVAVAPVKGNPEIKTYHNISQACVSFGCVYIQNDSKDCKLIHVDNFPLNVILTFPPDECKNDKETHIESVVEPNSEKIVLIRHNSAFPTRSISFSYSNQISKPLMDPLALANATNMKKEYPAPTREKKSTQISFHVVAQLPKVSFIYVNKSTEWVLENTLDLKLKNLETESKGTTFKFNLEPGKSYIINAKQINEREGYSYGTRESYCITSNKMDTK